MSCTQSPAARLAAPLLSENRGAMGRSSGERGSSGKRAAKEDVAPVSPSTAASGSISTFSADWSGLPAEAPAESNNNSDYYFNSYAHIGIHEEMIKDATRTGAYHRAISQNAHLFENKVVLDVGAGSGILSMFAARAGAKHVYGVECSEIVEVARAVVRDNGLSDRITFIKAKAEDIELPVDKVDIIISEWMGYFLLYESMLDCVLDVRDKWLKPGGLIFPDKAVMKMCAIEDAEYKAQKVDFWDSVYGLDFSQFKRCVIEEPLVDVVEAKAVATNTCTLATFDLLTCKKEDLEFTAQYSLNVTRKDFLHALVVWFDVEFTACHKPVFLTTSPFHATTHWKQTVFYIEDVLVAEKGDSLSGLVAVRKNAQNFRSLDVKMSYVFTGTRHRKGVHFYRIR